MHTMLLHPLAGDWHATNHLWFMPGTPAFESHTALTITPAVQDTAMTLRYTWSHEGAPPDGALLVQHYNILPDGQEALAIEARYTRG